MPNSTPNQPVEDFPLSEAETIISLSFVNGSPVQGVLVEPSLDADDTLVLEVIVNALTPGAFAAIVATLNEAVTAAAMQAGFLDEGGPAQTGTEGDPVRLVV